MQLGQMIKRIRQENKLSQDDFAAKFNVTRQTVSNWENEKSYPDLLTLVKISDMFGYSLDSMLKENPVMTETMNKNIKYGESSALLGGISAFLLSIILLEMIILQVGSMYLWLGTLVVILANGKAMGITLGEVKKESKKTKVFFGMFCLVIAAVGFGVLWFIR